MRTYGRINGTTWVEVSTDSVNGDSFVWITTLCQNFLLNLNESPFYAQNGIPAHPAVVQQVFPDYYVALIQQSFAQFFASLIVTKLNDPSPRYLVNITTKQGVKVNASVPIPQ